MMKYVIIAEEDPHRARLFEAALRGPDTQLEIYLDGNQALRRLENTPTPSLCILDLALPGKSGLEILDRLRDRDVKKFPVLAVSSRYQESEERRTLSHGASGYIAEPIDTDHLAALVRSLLKS